MSTGRGALANMVEAYDLLERQNDDVEEPNFTDKQVAIVRETIQNSDAEVEEVAEWTDSHPNYVRDILTRLSVEGLADREEFADLAVSSHDESPSADDSDGDEGEDDVEDEGDGDEEESEEDESSAHEQPATLPVGKSYDPGDKEPSGNLKMTLEQDVPMQLQVQIPQDIIYEAVRSVLSMAPDPDEERTPDVANTIEIDPDLTTAVRDRFDMGEQKAKKLILKMGSQEAREMVGLEPENSDEEMVDQPAPEESAA